MIPDDRVARSLARNKGDTVCTNRRMNRRSGIKAPILNALTEHLMDLDLVSVFFEVYTTEANRLRANSGAARAMKDAEFQKVRRNHRKLVDAIVAGVPGEQVKDPMTALDTRRRQLETGVSASAPAEQVRLQLGMAGT